MGSDVTSGVAYSVQHMWLRPAMASLAWDDLDTYATSCTPGSGLQVLHPRNSDKRKGKEIGRRRRNKKIEKQGVKDESIMRQEGFAEYSATHYEEEWLVTHYEEE